MTTARFAPNAATTAISPNPLAVFSERWLAALLLLPSLFWAFRQRTVFWWDQAWYADATVTLWSVLLNDPAAWPKANLDALAIKAPGIAWLGQFFVPLGTLVGDIDAALLLSIVLTMAVGAVLMFRIGEFVSPDARSAPWIGTLLVAASPLFIALTGQFLVEGLQTLAVTYVYWVACAALRWPATRTLGHLALASSLAMLAKASSPLYCFLPWSLALWNAFRAPRRDGLAAAMTDRTSRTWLAAGCLAAAATAAWYWRNFPKISEFVKLASSGDAAYYYGNARPFFTKFADWCAALIREFFVPEALAVLSVTVLLSLAVSALRFRRIRPPRRDIDAGKIALGLVAAGQLLAVLAVFSLNVNEDHRYLLPLVPALSILAAALSAVLPPVARALVLAALLGEWLYVHGHQQGLFSPDSRLFFYLHPEQSVAEKRSELRRLEAETCDAESHQRWRMLGVDIAWLNLATLNYYSAKAALARGFRCNYASLGWAEKEVSSALERIKTLQPRYFIGLSSPADVPRDPFNRVSVPVLETIRRSGEWIPVEFSNRFGILILRPQAKIAGG